MTLPFDCLGFPAGISNSELRTRLKAAMENKQQINNFIDAVTEELAKRGRATGRPL